MAANRLVLLAVVPLFLVLAVVAYITIQFAANEREAQRWVRHTYQVMESLRTLQDDVQGAESSIRGYLIAHNPTFVTVYRARAARVPADMKQCRALAADSPDQLRRADRLQKLINTRFEGLRAAERAGSAGSAPTPVVTQALERARQQMAAIRSDVEAGTSPETKDIVHLTKPFDLGQLRRAMGV